MARVKLAYIADSTSSAVACVAVISTWIAFQLSMISEAYALTGAADYQVKLVLPDLTALNRLLNKWAPLQTSRPYMLKEILVMQGRWH